MPSTDRSGPSTFDAYVEERGGWQSSKPSDGLGAERCECCECCECCGEHTERFLGDQCEDCARWEHGFDQGERDATEALLANVLTGLAGDRVEARHEVPPGIVWAALRRLLVV